jgi:hypothetical protein
MVALDAGAHEVGAAIGRVLGDEPRRAAMRAAAERFANEWTFRRVADELADVIRKTIGT